MRGYVPKPRLVFSPRLFAAIGIFLFWDACGCEKRRGVIEIELRRKDDDARDSILL